MFFVLTLTAFLLREAGGMLIRDRGTYQKFQPPNERLIREGNIFELLQYLTRVHFKNIDLNRTGTGYFQVSESYQELEQESSCDVKRCLSASSLICCVYPKLIRNIIMNSKFGFSELFQNPPINI